jgi:predicted RNA-binding protein Jag
MTAPLCPAKELHYLVGQPRTVLYTMRFGTEVRIEEPGQAVTMDYRGSRTRVIIGSNGKIASVVCG